LRVTYKELFFPAYNFADGNAGYYGTPWYHQSEKRRVRALNYIDGKKIYENGKFRIESTFIIGWALVKRYVTRYYTYSNNDPAPRYNYEHLSESFNRVSIGFGWTFYFKAYERSFPKL
jgi:hypothetical protein